MMITMQVVGRYKNVGSHKSGCTQFYLQILDICCYEASLAAIFNSTNVEQLEGMATFGSSCIIKIKSVFFVSYGQSLHANVALRPLSKCSVYCYSNFPFY